MATQKDMQKDYVVRVKGKKVDIIYKSSDEELCRNFLVHLVKTTILEDIVISIKGPVKEDDLIENILFCTTGISGSATGQDVVWTNTDTVTGTIPPTVLL